MMATTVTKGATNYWRETMNINEATVNKQKIMAFTKIHSEFTDILKKEKCRTCSCFYSDILNSIYSKIKSFRETESDARLIKIENDFERWVKDAGFQKMHG